MSNQEQIRTEGRLDKRPLSLSTVKSTAQKWWGKIIGLSDSVDLPKLFVLFFLIRMLFIFPIAKIEESYFLLAHYRRLFFYQMLGIVSGEIVLALLLRSVSTKSYKALFNKKRFKATVNTYRKDFCKTFNKVDIAVLLYLGFVLISMFFANDKELSFKGYSDRNNGFIMQACCVWTYFLISRFFRSRKSGLNLYCFGGAMVAVLLLLHFFDHDVLKTEYTANRIFVGPMGNIDYTSYFLTVALILAAAIYITKQYLPFDKGGYVILACFVVTLWAELLIEVDSGIVAMGIALLVSLPLLLISFDRAKRFFTLLSLGMGVAIFNRLIVNTDVRHEEFGKEGWLMLAAELVLVAITVVVHNNRLKLAPSHKTMLIIALIIDGAAILALLLAARKAALDEEDTTGILYELGQMIFHHNFDDHFGSTRLFIWKRAFKLAKKHLLFGTGPDSFTRAFKLEYKEEVTQYYGNFYVGEAHNEYLHLLVCSGLTALISFLAFLGLMIVKGFQRAKEQPLLACCVMGVIGYAVHAFFMPSIPVQAPLMWIILGLTGSAIRADEPVEEPGRKKEIGKKILNALARFTEWLNNGVHALQEKQLQAADEQ